jgi:dTDP-4-amino-4,6-dideoxygalactose transaminase
LNGLPMQLPSAPVPGSRHAYHLYTPLLELQELSVSREKIVAALDAENIGVGIHYIPVHQHPYYRRRFGFRDSDFPNAAFVGERTISIPLSAGMSQQDASDVAIALTRIFRYYKASA